MDDPSSPSLRTYLIADDDVYAPYTDALIEAKRRYGVETETLVVTPDEREVPRSVQERLDQLDLVLLAGPSVHGQFVDQLAAHPKTKFVFVDPDPEFDHPRLPKRPNYSDVFFIEGPPAYLAGYLSAREAKRTTKASPTVSFIGIDPAVSTNQDGGFEAGAAAGGAKVIADYSHDVSHPAVCERIANQQIDRDSQAVYAAAGRAASVHSPAQRCEASGASEPTGIGRTSARTFSSPP